jgi:hypothetical protein
MGFNCAEAVNFACKNWVNLGSKAGVCRCINDSVKIDMNQFTDILCQKKLINKSEDRNKSSSTEKMPKLHNTKEDTKENIKDNSKQRNAKEEKAGFVGRKKRRSISKENNKKSEPIDNWLCCDECNKWRKISKSKLVDYLLDIDLDQFKSGFKCNFIKNLNCNSAEEKWRRKYTTIKRNNSSDSSLSRKAKSKYYKSMERSIVNN